MNNFPIVNVPKDTQVSLSVVAIPEEVDLRLGGVSFTIPGVMVASPRWCIEFSGSTYHLLPKYPTSPLVEAIDIETGDVVNLDFTEFAKQGEVSDLGPFGVGRM